MHYIHFLLINLLVLLAINPAWAHKLRPAIVTVTVADRSVALEIETNVEALLAGIGTQHDNTDDAPNAQQYRELRALESAVLEQRFAKVASDYARGQKLSVNGAPVDWIYQRAEIPEIGDQRLARKSTLYFSASQVLNHDDKLVWQRAPQYGEAVINLVGPGGDRQSYWLPAGEPSPTIEPGELGVARSGLDVAKDYLYLGFVHIVPGGLDHILFVLGLFLLSRRLGPLLWQVTAFTLAHTITLALSIYGVVSVPAAVVEPLIALSIAYVGIENILTRELKPWRVALVFVFGLLHGLGFAGVLNGLGLPEGEFLTALLFFNIGVEAGQVAVILSALLLLFYLRQQDAVYRRMVVIPGSLIIAVMGLYWFVTRL